MIKKVCTAGALWVALVATQPVVLLAQPQQPGHGGPLNRTAPPPPRLGERMAARQQVHPMDRWMAMPAQVRESALARLNPERREKVQQQLDNWQRMTPLQRDRARWFFNLPPEQKEIVREFNQWHKTLPEERRPVIRREINSMQELSPEAREAELGSPSFNRRFDADEREHIRKMVSVLPE